MASFCPGGDELRTLSLGDPFQGFHRNNAVFMTTFHCVSDDQARTNAGECRTQLDSDTVMGYVIAFSSMTHISYRETWG